LPDAHCPMPNAEIFYVLKSTYYLSTMWSYSLAFLASSL